jgi:hypothetical protein
VSRARFDVLRLSIASARRWFIEMPGVFHVGSSTGRSRTYNLENVSSATDGVSQCSKDHEDQANQKDDDSDRPNDRYGGDEPNDEKDYAEDDHGVIATSEVRGQHKPTCRTHTVEGGLDPIPFPE